MAYKTGDKIRVLITGTAGPKPVPGLSATNKITETGADRRAHYLFLDSPFITGDKKPDGTVRAEFTAVITGDIQASLNSTTSVVEIRKDGRRGYRHYVYLNSAAVVPVIPPFTERPPEEAKPDAGRITPGSAVIESTAVMRRIAALEEKTRPTGYCLTRNSSGEPLDDAVLPTRAAALEYLDGLDYNMERFAVKSLPKLDEADRLELNELRQLDADGTALFGAARWAKGVTLRRDGFYDAEWAREQAAAMLGITIDLLDEWPLCLIDWAGAAQALLDADYLAVTVGGQLFRGKEATG